MDKFFYLGGIKFAEFYPVEKNGNHFVIAGVKFEEADYQLLIGIFLIIFAAAMIVYFALFVDDYKNTDDDEAQPSSVIQEESQSEQIIEEERQQQLPLEPEEAIIGKFTREKEISYVLESEVQQSPDRLPIPDNSKHIFSSLLCMSCPNTLFLQYHRHRRRYFIPWT